MKATCTSWSWSLLPFDQVAMIMSILGFDAIDVGAFAGWAHYEPAELAARPKEMAHVISEIAGRNELALTDLIVTFGPGLTDHCVNFPDQEVRDANLETFKRLTDFCGFAGISGISLCPGVEHETIGRAASFDIAAQELARLSAAGHNAGLRVSFEPHVNSISESPADALRLVELADHLSLTLDYSHFVQQGYTDQDVAPLLGHTGHFHVRQACAGQLQCRTQEGTIDFDRALGQLQENGYDGCVAFEYVWEQWMDNDRVDVLSETLVLRRQLAKYFA